jgi:hypothetical protein
MNAGIIREPKHRYIFLRLGIGWHYAEKGGKLCLRDQTSWRKIAGVWINTRWGCWWIYFRRYSKFFRNIRSEG